MSTKTRRRSLLLIPAVAATLFAAAACSSGNSSSTAGSSGTSNNAAQTSASGSPILIGGMAPLSSPVYSIPQAKATMQAAVDSINAAGGVKGHPLKLDFCDTQFQASLELSCARQLISDNVVAVVDPTIVVDQSGAEFKLFKAAGIAFFGGAGTSTTETSDSNSYPLSSGGPGWTWGAVKALKLAGVKKVVIYANAGSAAQYIASQVSQAITGLGLQNGGTVLADVQSDPTLASSAAKVVATGSDGVFAAVANFALEVQALSQAGYKGKIATTSALTGSQALKTLGSLGNGILVSSQTAFYTDSSNPGVQAFLAAMQKYAPGTAVDSNLPAFYAAVELFAKVMETSTSATLNSAAFTDAVNNVATPINIGLIGPWATKGRGAALSADPRVLNPNIAIGIVKNGEVVPYQQGFSDPFTP
jgi:branched-chain amino acid transport system substrate-binding protein